MKDGQRRERKRQTERTDRERGKINQNVTDRE
jgi:hypothetical protein